MILTAWLGGGAPGLRPNLRSGPQRKPFGIRTEPRATDSQPTAAAPLGLGVVP